MARKSSTLVKQDEDMAIELGRHISGVVLHLALRRGYTQATLAEKLGYSRASLNQILNSTTSARLWRLPGMCAAARVLEIPLSDLIRAAERRIEGAYGLPLSLSLAGTKPQSDERLTLLVREALQSYPAADEILFGDNYEVLFGCRVKDIELGAPAFYSQYREGKLGDPDALAILNAAVKYVSEHGGLGEFPLWAALKEEWSEVCG